MSRYIDADDIDFFECRIPTICQPNKYSEARIIIKSIGIFAKKEQIDQIPSADVEPVRHGHWEKSSIPNEKYCCSVCGGACWYYDYEADVARSRFCPNCGAKMDGKE